MTPGTRDTIKILAGVGMVLCAIAGGAAGAFLNGDSGVGMVTTAVLLGGALACAFVCALVIDRL